MLTFCLLVLIGINLAVNNFLKEQPIFHRFTYFDQLEPSRREILFNEAQKQITEVRVNDLNAVRNLSFYSLIPITLLSFMVGYYISGVFLSPIKSLGLKMKSMGTDNLGEVIEYDLEDEIGVLIQNFNLMSIRIKEAFENQKSFIQNASHELKTPITIVQSSLDVTLSNKNASIEELRDAMNDALSGVVRLKKLSNNLLELSAPSSSIEEFDLIDLIKEIIIELNSYIEKNNIQLTPLLTDQLIIINGCKIDIRRALTNVIQNAIKYCKEAINPQIEIEVDRIDNNALIFVKDNGILIPIELRDKIFERFYRISKSSEGNGLGLSIAKEILNKVNGSIGVIDSNEDFSTIFEIKIPLA